MTLEEQLHLLSSFPRHSFRDWPNPAIPPVTAGVYTIWLDNVFVYVGMSGRDLSPEKAAQLREAGKKKALWERLNSHRLGRRSGDQFNVYVADRLVLPGLSRAQIESIAAGHLRFDDLVRDYIQRCLSYQFVAVASGEEAYALEGRIREGRTPLGGPLLNPG